MADSLATAYYNSATSSISKPHKNPLFFRPLALVWKSMVNKPPQIQAKPFGFALTELSTVATSRQLNLDGTTTQFGIQSHLKASVKHSNFSHLLNKKMSVKYSTGGWTPVNKDENSRKTRNLNAPDATLQTRTRTISSNAKTAEPPRQKKYNALVLLHALVTTRCGSSRSWSTLHNCMSQGLHSGQNPGAIHQQKHKISPELTIILNQAYKNSTTLAGLRLSAGTSAENRSRHTNMNFPNRTPLR